MATQIEICNMAILEVGGNRIDDINATEIEAVLCKANYDTCRKAALEDAEWSFAIDRVALAPDALPPAFGWGFQFTLPAGVLRVLKVAEDIRFDYPTRWVREGNKILCDSGTIYVRFIKNVVDTLLFSDKFALAFSLLLASKLAIPIAHSTKIKVELIESYRLAIMEAANKDGMQGTNTTFQNHQYINAR
jgi:hypothetical protein